jgi:hypothetical protein
MDLSLMMWTGGSRFVPLPSEPYPLFLETEDDDADRLFMTESNPWLVPCCQRLLFLVDDLSDDDQDEGAPLLAGKLDVQLVDRSGLVDDGGMVMHLDVDVEEGSFPPFPDGAKIWGEESGGSALVMFRPGKAVEPGGVDPAHRLYSLHLSGHFKGDSRRPVTGTTFIRFEHLVGDGGRAVHLPPSQEEPRAVAAGDLLLVAPLPLLERRRHAIRHWGMQLRSGAVVGVVGTGRRRSLQGTRCRSSCCCC